MLGCRMGLHRPCCRRGTGRPVCEGVMPAASSARPGDPGAPPGAGVPPSSPSSSAHAQRPHHPPPSSTMFARPLFAVFGQGGLIPLARTFPDSERPCTPGTCRAWGRVLACGARRCSRALRRLFFSEVQLSVCVLQAHVPAGSCLAGAAGLPLRRQVPGRCGAHAHKLYPWAVLVFWCCAGLWQRTPA